MSYLLSRTSGIVCPDVSCLHSADACNAFVLCIVCPITNLFAQPSRSLSASIICFVTARVRSDETSFSLSSDFTAPQIAPCSPIQVELKSPSCPSPHLAAIVLALWFGDSLFNLKHTFRVCRNLRSTEPKSSRLVVANDRR